MQKSEEHNEQTNAGSSKTKTDIMFSNVLLVMRKVFQEFKNTLKVIRDSRHYTKIQYN